MDNHVFDLLIKRMDDHKEESNRRFDELSKQIAEVEKTVSSLSQWRWTTKGKIAGISLVGSGVLFFTAEWIKSLFK